MKRTIPAFFLLLALAGTAGAHGFARYVSTPVTPPIEFVWWGYVASTIFILGTLVIIWRLLDRHWFYSIVMSCCTLALFITAFVMFGRFASSMSTAPPPGLGEPCDTFWGMGWDEVGGLFVQWNLYGFGFFLCSLFICGGIRRARKRFVRPAVTSFVIYVIALAPYIATGALVHGWTGSYVDLNCSHGLGVLCKTLIEYSKEHDGQLPTVDGIDALSRELEPYLAKSDSSCFRPDYVCPLGDAYERRPKRYVWNTDFSGKPYKDIDLDIFFSDEGPLSCSYHRYRRPLFEHMRMKRELEREREEALDRSDAGDGPKTRPEQ